MQFEFTKVRDVNSPTRGTYFSSWLDFYIPNDLKPEDVKITPLNEPVKLDASKYVTDEDVIIPGWRWMLIPSGLRVKMTAWAEDFTYDLVLIGKSGISIKTDLLVWASVIDNDYRWEFNLHVVNPWLNDVVLKKGTKLVQGIIRRCELPEMKEISNELYEKRANTERGEGWFGSTGA